MSRIGRKPIVLPKGVSVAINECVAVVKGPKGQLERVIPEGVHVGMENNVISVTRDSDVRTVRSLHGLTRALVNNMVVGVSEGFTKVLVLFGVGFKMELKGGFLVMNLGYSHPIYLAVPEGIQMEATQPVNNTSELKITGINKEIVGLVADKVRSFKKPEPYKGKGFRYKNEHIVKKAGKTAK